MNDIRMIGVFGVGGIGKTTITKAIYNLNAYQFEDSCFLANVRETSKRECGLVQLQEKLLYDILGDSSLKVDNVDRGINIIKERLCCKRILLVLDDVDQLAQLEALSGESGWFGLGSRIIITTRDKHLLTKHKVDLTYKVKQMDHNEALQLFSWHAFKKDKPIDGFVQLSEHALRCARGLPLALVVLGSNLYGRSFHEWKSALDKCKRLPNKNIHNILRVSYDDLDDNEKDIFLDIACFFKGEDADYVVKILDSCGFFPDIGIRVLSDKSLVTIEENNRLVMHDLIQEMGREIVRQESPKEPGRHSRLWFHEDVRYVLEENTGTNKIEGILVELPERDLIHLSSKAFTKMKRLRFFINPNACFSEGPNYLSNELRLLDWPEYPLQALPSNFHGKKLSVFRVSNSLFKELKEVFENFQNMKIMELSDYCKQLQEIVELPPNIKEVDASGCMSLEIFPEASKKFQFNACNLKALEWIDLCGCHKMLVNIGNHVADPLLGKGQFKDLLGGIILPGNRIPDWFSHRKETSNINSCEMDINGLLYMDEVVGIVLCAIIGPNILIGRERPLHSIGVKINDNEVQERVVDLMGSDHVWLEYVVLESFKPKEDNMQVKFYRYLDELVFFKSCGVHLVHKHEENVKDHDPALLHENVDVHLDVPSEEIENS
ncbi:disease resistance protein RUN1-like isoform X4 [Juglans microcarpa x Juglans regia]|uniref:disease resistance protein RUN1-like isoform X4 n=1 Tax=Juglans microcarpa x Juglans regia TaxID=2249226 RepID=UPI001B7E4C7F|nr:disease resistance protein RUN1-like isoform X4 [Juglans microcarpa x Juglans regia]